MGKKRKFKLLEVNMSEYYPPKYKSSSFHCLHCKTYTHQSWEFLYSDSGFINDEDGSVSVGGEKVEFSICAKCKGPTFWVEKKIVYPLRGSYPLVNSDLPNEVKDIYDEAASIANQSPRAACALLRLAIEMLLKHLGEKGSINDAIKNLVANGLDPKIQQSLDILRVTGNNAVHPGVIDFSDTTDAHAFFQLINVIADTFITQPKRIQEMYDNLPEKDLKAIETRDGQTK